MTERKKKTGILGLVMLCFAFLFVIIYMRYSKQNTLTVGVYAGSHWKVPGTSYYEMFQEAIYQFRDKYPNLNVTFQEGIPAEDYSEWLAGEILKGTEPDLYLVLPDDFSTLTKTGALLNLNEMILKDGDFQPDDFYQEAYRAGQRKAVQYAVPFECNPKLMFVNKSLLRNNHISVPSEDWTWEDFYAICHKISDASDLQEKDQYGYYEYSWLDAIYSNGETPFLEDGSDSCFTKSTVIDSLQFIKRMMEMQKNHLANYEDFDMGKVAFHPMSFSEYRTYMPYPWRIKKFSQFEWNCIPMPSGPQGDNTSSMETLMMGISAKSVNKTLAWELLKILTTDEDIQKNIYVYSAGASPLKKLTCSENVMHIINKEAPRDSQIDMGLLDQVMRKSVNPGHFLEYDQAIQYANNYINDCLDKGEDMHIAMFQLKKEMKKIMK